MDKVVAGEFMRGIPTSESLDIALVWKVGSAMGCKKRLWKCEEHGSEYISETPSHSLE